MTVKSRILVSAAVVALAVVLMVPSSHASCGTFKAFGQIGINGYTYTFMPTTSTNSQASIIGSFWEVGAAATDSSGAGCPDDAWVKVCDASQFSCGGNPTGKTRYMYGAMAGPGCQPTNGCPGGGDANFLVQDVSTDGQHSFFALARVSETLAASTAYDLTRLSANVSLVEIPRPTVNSSSRAGTTINLNVNLNAVQTGFFGLAGQTAQGPGNISGVRIMTFTGLTDPGRGRAAGWQADTISRPYTGASINVPLFAVNCANIANDVFVATALEFDGGAVTSDYVSQSVRVECDPNIADPKRFRSLEKPSGIQKAPPRN